MLYPTLDLMTFLLEQIYLCEGEKKPTQSPKLRNNSDTKNHFWVSRICQDLDLLTDFEKNTMWWESFQLFENKLDTRRASSALSQKDTVKHLPTQIHISDTESDWEKEKTQRFILTNRGK